jgi:predicted nucleotidyltransferase component of viral defense system
MKKEVRNLAASVHERLLNQSRATARPFSELLQYYAMERFLYRLSKSEHAGKFVLKGALMWTALELPPGRPTMDIDVQGRFRNDPTFAAQIVKDICTQPVESDGLKFDPETASATRIREAAEYHGIRVRFDGKLGKAAIHMQVDIGFGDLVRPEIRKIFYPTILDFPAPTLKMYSLESSIAEKFEAMVKLGMLNSRMKDFYDIWKFSRNFEFIGRLLAEAIKATFEHRGTEIPEVPVALSESFYNEIAKSTQWRTFVRKNRLKDIPELPDIVQEISRFLIPVATGIRQTGTFTARWSPGAAWIT